MFDIYFRYSVVFLSTHTRVIKI